MRKSVRCWFVTLPWWEGGQDGRRRDPQCMIMHPLFPCLWTSFRPRDAERHMTFRQFFLPSVDGSNLSQSQADKTEASTLPLAASFASRKQGRLSGWRLHGPGKMVTWPMGECTTAICDDGIPFLPHRTQTQQTLQFSTTLWKHVGTTECRSR